MSDAYGSYLDQWFPESAPQQAQDPYSMFMDWWMTQQLPSAQDPNAQSVLALTQPRYQGQNLNTYLNNAMDYQNQRTGQMWDVFQAQQDQANEAAQLDLATQKNAREQQAFEYEHPNYGDQAEMVALMIDPATLEAAMNLDPAAMREFGNQVATAVGEVDNNGDPKITNITRQMMQAILARPTAQELQAQQAQQMLDADTEERLNRTMPMFAKNVGQEAGPAIRQIAAESQNPGEIMGFLGANAGNAGMARAAMQLAMEK